MAPEGNLTMALMQESLGSCGEKKNELKAVAGKIGQVCESSAMCLSHPQQSAQSHLKSNFRIIFKHIFKHYYQQSVKCDETITSQIFDYVKDERNSSLKKMTKTL